MYQMVSSDRAGGAARRTLGSGQAMECIKWSHPIVLGVLCAEYSLHVQGCPLEISAPD